MEHLNFLKNFISNMFKIKSIYQNTVLYRSYIKWLIYIDNKNILNENNKVRGPLIDKYLPKNKTGAELGVLLGNFSKILLKYSNAKELHLVDLWYFFGSEWNWAGGNASTVDALIKVLKENKKEINESKIIVHVQDDLIFLKEKPDNYFDWVYIDSAHEYEHTIKELELLIKKVKLNGIVCGDDWRPNPIHRHHGVYKAVMEFVEKGYFEILYSNDQDLQWFLKLVLK